MQYNRSSDLVRTSSFVFLGILFGVVGAPAQSDNGTIHHVRVSGDLAVAWGTQETKTTLKAGGNPVQEKTRWITVYQRQPDKSWKIVWEMYNSGLPAPDSYPTATEKY
jgi:hypothetical protein